MDLSNAAILFQKDLTSDSPDLIAKLQDAKLFMIAAEAFRREKVSLLALLQLHPWTTN
jgi:hypothetical protein